MDSSKMQSIYAPGEFPITHSSEEESSRDSSIVGTRPATPEFGQAANRGSLEQHTPDTTPESIRVAPRRRKDPVHLGRQRNIDLATTSILSEAPSIEEIADTTSTSGYSQHLRYNKLKQETSNSSNHSSHHSIDSQVSEEASITSCPDRKKGYSAVVSIYNSVITFFNLARRQKPRADSARVQDAIKLIKSLPRIRRTRFTNLRRPLTASQYDQLLVRIQNEEFEEKLRFEYTHSISQFEIRMTTPIHEGIVGEFNAIFTLWREELKKLRGSGISDVAETLRPNGNQHVKLPLDGATDPKSPDGGIKHKCNLRCKYPALVFEVEFANNSREELRDKAEAYSEFYLD
ncbi:hypothetical protein F4802DRAFT_457718 [Xylaria palmicola]|nr:hypothetical protein F4802DRAFT_457718 [Xylaria palmicola]